MSKHRIDREISKREREYRTASPERKIAIQNELEYLKFLRTVR